jgi:hypothetical protein
MFPVRYEKDSIIPEDSILYSHFREIQIAARKVTAKVHLHSMISLNNRWQDIT